MTCAFAVRGALKKFPGVQSVEVSLNKGLAVVKLQPGNTLAPEQLWEAVKKNGFTPKQTRVVVKGRLLEQSGKLQLKVSGLSKTLDVAAESAAAKKFIGAEVTAEGSLTPGQALLHVEALR